MKRIGYRNGYRIQIKNGFYEVTSGKRVYHYGYCHKNSAIQEIANKTIMLDDDEDAEQRNKFQYKNNTDYNR